MNFFSKEASIKLDGRAKEIFENHQQALYKHTDYLLGILMVAQWIASIAIAVWISPKTWIGSEFSAHVHVIAAVVLGGLISLFPVFLIYAHPGHKMTRYVIAAAQMLMSSLLIHLTGGRIETHFHVFGSLAILAFYRDFTVLIPATLIVALDHWIRGVYFPQSVFGILTVSPWRWVEHAGWVIFEDIFLVVSCLRSVAEVKQTASRQAQLETVNETIAAEVKKQTEEISEMRDQAMAASKAKSEFLATMSHEIRTPMNAILGMSELLAEENLDPEQKEYVETLRRNGDHLLDLINDILDLSKIEVGKLQLETVPFDLHEMVEHVTELMAVRAHQKGLELMHRIAPNVPRIVVGDGVRLRQIVTNLVGNAVKFTDKGEVVVDIKCSNKVNVETSPTLEVEFSVRDTGIGIPAEKLESIFGAFTQGDSSTTRKFGGTGLGLSISRRLVEMMQGKIWAESQPGKGSAFLFTACFGRSMDVEQPPVVVSDRDVNLKNIRVLIVDDNKTNRFIIREMLKNTEAKMEDAEDGRSGLEMLHAAKNMAPFHLILLDCRMPGMDGFEFVREVQRDSSLRSIPIMMLTSDDRKGYVEKARNLGLALYLIKPIRKMELLNAIHDAMRKSKHLLEPQPGFSSAKAAAPQDSKTSPFSILLVEDNQDNRLLIQSYLKRLDCNLETAVNGQEALDKFAAKHYNVILMDLHMPVMDGYEATRKIRQIEKDKNLKRTVIIAVSASVLSGEIVKSIEAGCDQHLSKPVKKDILIKALENCRETQKGEGKAAA